MEPVDRDPLPEPPVRPAPGDCCGGGCTPCVFELYESELAAYEAALKETRMSAHKASKKARKARAIGFNHVALEVGDIDAALEFYGRLFEFTLRSRSESDAFIDLGDQFIALQKGRRQGPDDGRHFGLVVDDKQAVREALAAAGVPIVPGPFLDFLDPWGNRIEIVSYENVQFTKAPNVLRGMGLDAMRKNAAALEELAAKGMAPDPDR